MERTEAKAVAKTIRIAPRKTRLIIENPMWFYVYLI